MTERLDPLPDWLTAPSARAVIAALEAAGGAGCARFVGGCVRDTLLGRADQVTDVDVATTLTPDLVTKALEAEGLRAIPTGIEHGTVTALSGGRAYEITTLRRDVETDGRRAVVAFTDDWAQDAARRDFRLNALYAEPDGRLHDPTGGGLADVAARRIVFVGDPETRIREDYLRILRFFRFLARVGDAAEADPAGLAACAKLKDGIAGLSGERVREEMFKLLGAPSPARSMGLMVASGVLAQALPRANNAWFLDVLIEQDELFGPSDAVLRLAVMLDDTEAAKEVSKRLRLSNFQSERLQAMMLIVWPHASLPSSPDAVGGLSLSPRGLRLPIYRYGGQAVQDWLRLDAANSFADGRAWIPLLDFARSWSPPPFPLTGEDIKALGVPEGPLVGVVRKAVEQWWIDGDFQTGKAEALAFARTVVEAA